MFWIGIGITGIFFGFVEITVLLWIALLTPIGIPLNVSLTLYCMVLVTGIILFAIPLWKHKGR